MLVRHYRNPPSSPRRCTTCVARRNRRSALGKAFLPLLYPEACNATLPLMPSVEGCQRLDRVTLMQSFGQVGKFCPLWNSIPREHLVTSMRGVSPFDGTVVTVGQ